MTTLRIPQIVFAGVAVLAALSALPHVSLAQINPDIIDGAIARTVLLNNLARVPGQENELRMVGSCSGSFVSPDGVILTASHCVRARADKPDAGIRKGELFNPNGITAVSVHVPDQARPVLMMLARYVADDPALDLAVIRVYALLGQGGQQSISRDFRVPHIVIGDSDKLRHGEALAVVGFPDVGGKTVTASQGHVTGFLADEQNRRLWVKLEAASGPGGSGGPVINGRGEQVAVISWGRADPAQAVRSIQAMAVNRLPSEWQQHIRAAGPAPAPAPIPAPAPAPAPAPVPPRPAPAPAPVPAPAPAPPAQSAHVVLQGRLVDAATGAGIQGGAVLILKPGVSPREATRDDIIAGGGTDGNGLFQTKPPVQRGFKYPLVVLAQGYQPLFAGIEVGLSGSDVISVTIKLARQQ